ncbi:RNA-directed DNA polymerase, eukaryota, reverse transcriptase zinc-binding domain protein [Tanacetum coccineum]
MKVRDAMKEWLIFIDSQAKLLTSFIEDSSLNDIPFMSYNFTWTDKCHFREVVNDWTNDGIANDNGMVQFKKKLQHLKNVIRGWLGSKKAVSLDLKNKHLDQLSSIDVKVDLGIASEEDFKNRRDSLMVLGDLERVEETPNRDGGRLQDASDLQSKGCVFVSTAAGGGGYVELSQTLREVKGCWEAFLTVDTMRDRRVDARRLRRRVRLREAHNGLGDVRRRMWLSIVISDCVNPVQSAFIKGRNILDGPLILNEVLAWHRQRKKELMVFKVDFEKAFDSLRWDFLDLILDKLGFGSTWRAWIRGCLYNSRSFVLVNGSQTEEFVIHRGLRQGDPMSPFLFILAMEGLHALTCKAEALGLFKGVTIGRDNLSISHLMYADDAIFFGDWSWINAQNLISMLRCFFLISGLQINIHKSSVLGVGVHEAEFSSKLSSWKARLLSVGGRLSLIRSVLGNLPIYYMSLYPMPVAIRKKLESMRNKFFIGGDPVEKKLTWIKWDKCLASKREGKRTKTLKSKGIDLFSYCTHKIGNGLDSSFWSDLWCGNQPLKVMFPRIFLIETDKQCSIASRVGLIDWSSVLWRVPRGGKESSQFNALLSIIGSTSLSDQWDVWQWSLNGLSGFSVASVRHLVDSWLLDTCNDATRWKSMFFFGGDLVTVNHTFFNCGLAKELWSILAKLWDLDIPMCGNIAEWHAWLGDLHVSSKVRLAIEGVGGTLLWSIWNFRNNLIFSSTPPKKSMIWDSVVSQSFLWISSRNLKCKISWIGVLT